MVNSRLRVIIAERGLKQKFLSDKTGVNRTSMSLIINGQQIPTLENALKISKALNLNVEDIWSLEDK